MKRFDLVLVVGAVVATMAYQTTQAIPITGNDATLANAIGYIHPGVEANSDQGTESVNLLLQFAGGGADPSDDNFDFFVVTSGTYVPAVYADKTGGAGSGVVKLETGGYAYLAVKYDGADGSLQVWDILGVVGDVNVPRDDQYGTTRNKYYLFNSVPFVTPDGGASLALLGMGLIGLGVLRRKLS